MSTRISKTLLAMCVAGLLLSISADIVFAQWNWEDEIEQEQDKLTQQMRTVGLICCVCGGISLVLNLLLLIWVSKDAQKRGTTAGAWLLIVLLLGLPGLLIYLVARPQGRLEPCPNCGVLRPITAQVCPHCGFRG